MQLIGFDDFPTQGRERLTEGQIGSVLHFLSITLSEPHPGRGGAICPMMHVVMKHKRVYFGFFERGALSDISQAARLMLRRFEKTRSTINAPTVLICFPHDLAVSFDEMYQIQKELSARILRQRTSMLSLIHPWALNESMYGVPGFCPLRVEVPAFIIRDVVPNDLPLLSRERGSREERVRMFEMLIKVIEQHPDSDRNQLYLAEAQHCLELANMGQDCAVDPGKFFR